MVKKLGLICCIISLLHSQAIPLPKPPEDAPTVRFPVTIPQMVSIGHHCSGSIVQIPSFRFPAVLTAAHCVRGMTEKIYFHDNAVRTMRLVYLGDKDNEADDWAVYQGDTREIQPLEIAAIATDQLALVGSSINGVNTVQVYEQANSELLYIFGWVFPGDSGSPLINSQDEILGIVTARWIGKPRGFGVPIRRIIEQIKYRRSHQE